MSDDTPDPTRRTVLRTLAATGTVLGPALSSTAAASQVDGDAWPQFAGNAANTGTASGLTGPTNDPGLTWSRRASPNAAPVIADGTVYTASTDAVRARDLSTGAVEWAARSDGGDGGLALDGRRLFTNDGGVRALSRSDGSEVWAVDLDGNRGAPTVRDGRVYIDGRRFGEDRTKLFAFDATDGNTVWEYVLGNDIRSAVAAGPNGLYFLEADDRLRSLAPDGAERWVVETDFRRAAPTLADGTVYAVAGDGIVGYDAADGTERWRVSDIYASASLTVADGVVYVPSGKDVLALDAETGESRWETAVPDFDGPPAVVDGRVYVGPAVLDATSGERLWELDAGDRRRTAVAVAEGYAVFGAEGGWYHALAAGGEGTTTGVGAVTTTPGEEWPAFGRGPANRSATAVAGPTGTPGAAWRFDAGGRIGSPVVAGGRVFVHVQGGVGTVENNVDGYLYALRAGDGRTLWRQPLGRAPDDVAGAAAPAVAGGHVFLAGAGATVRSNRTVALSAETGEVRVRSGWRALGSPTVVAGVLYGATNAIDLQQFGEQVWRTGHGQGPHVSPAVVDGSVYVTGPEGEVYAHDATTGQQAWRITSAAGPIRSSPTVVDGTVLFGTPGGTLRAVGTDGRDRWQASVDGAANTSPAVAGGRAVIGTDAGSVVAVDLDDGSVAWTAETGGRVRSAPAIADGVVHVGSDDGGLYAFALDSGAERWRYDAGAAVHTAPALVDGTVLVGSDDGVLHAITGGNGAETPGGGTTITATPTERASDGPSSGSGGTTPGREANELRLDGAPAWLADRWPLVAGAAGTLGLSSGLLWRRHRGDDAREGAGGPGSGGDGAGSGGGPSARPSAPATDTSAGDEPVDGGRGAPAPAAGTASASPALDTSLSAFDRGEPLGSGGTADVYRATHPDLDDPVALKLPRLPNADTVDRSLFESFAAEAETWAALDDHPHIVSVVDWGTTPHPWLALEYMDAGTVADQSFTPAQGVRAMWTVCEAVHHAHEQGVTHADLKPANLLCRRTDDGVLTGVADWGLARFLLEHSRTTDGLTPAYAAPEQLATDRFETGVTERTDIYQLGVVLYELLTGEHPFRADSHMATLQAVLEGSPTPPSEVADLPAAVDEPVLTALATAPGDRYPTALHLRDALDPGAG